MKRKLIVTLGDLGLSALILAASTGLGFLFRRWGLHETNVVVMYIFSVLLISRFTRGYGCGVGYGTDTQALRALMAGLRRKIEPVPARPRYILTEIGVGYRLSDE